MYSSLQIFCRKEMLNLTTLKLVHTINPHFLISGKANHFRCQQTRQIKDFYSKRSFSNKDRNTPNKNYLPYMAGVAGAIAIGTYIYKFYPSQKSQTIDIFDEDESDQPYVYENLAEDLKAINDFGPIPYLLIGAGNASFAAFRAIRVQNPTAKVLMVGEEPFYPYMRPPLSKEMWFDKKTDVAETLAFTQWSGRERSIFYEPEDYYFTVKNVLENKNGGVAVIRGKKVVKIDPESQSVFLDTGEEIKYEKCLIATGAKPKNLPIFEQADVDTKKHVTLFRNVLDFQKLDKISKKVKSIVIVGGGFLGSELACGLARRGETTGLKVTQIFPESGNMGTVLPEYLSKWTSKKLEKEGVTVMSDVSVKLVSKKGKYVELLLSNDEIVSAEHIVVAVGAEPSTEIAKSSGLEIDEKLGGFVVNTEMEARKNLWIAGDASCFYDMKLGRRRVEHHDHAVVSGRLAGENMAGLGKPYHHQSMFWSDLGPEVGFEAIGIVDSTLPTVGVFAKATAKDTQKGDADDKKDSTTDTIEQKTEPLNLENLEPRAPESSDNYGRGVVFYLRDNIIVGLVMWNVFSKMAVARKIINESKSYDDLSEVAKLFDLHSTEE